MLRKFFTIIFFLILSNINSQSINNIDIWDDLLKNNRNKALINFNKKLNNYSNSIEKMLIEKIIRVENGLLKSDTTFIKDFISQDDFQYYLYALWNDDFFFKNYLKSGFNEGTLKTLDIISKAKITDTTIKSSLTYLNAVVNRTSNDFEGYYKELSKISAIREWQYCGVFENLNNSGLDVVYDPEKKPYDTNGFDTNSNGIVNWYVPKEIDSNPYQILSNHSEYGTGVHYGQTFIELEEERRVILRISSSSSFKIWLNDVLILEDMTDVDRDLDAFSVEVTIPKGNSRLLVKNAESNSDSYFIVRVVDEKGVEIPNINYNNNYRDYIRSTKEEINPINKINSIEKYFLDKLKQNPNNFLYTYCLIKTYLRNQKYDKAKNIALPYLEKYPKSSFIKKILSFCYSYEGDNTTLKKIKNSMLHEDEDYYLSLMYKFQNQSELSRLDLEGLKKFLNKFSKAVDYDIMRQSADLVYNMRISNSKALRITLDSIINSTSDWLYMKKTYAPIYGSLLKDEEKSVKLYEELNTKYFDYDVKSYLIRRYNKLNQIEKSTKLYKEIYNNFKKEIFSVKDLANQLIKYKKYKEAVFYIDQGLEQFPYSFSLMKLKGDALLQIGEKEKAIEFYKKSIHHNKGNTKLRKKVKDLLGEKDLVEKLHSNDYYKYIKNNRGKVSNNNYGYNILLDQAIVILYQDGGGKSRYTFMYEITSESGVERFKEYDLELTGAYKIIKSEIVKETGEVIIADRKGSKFVFQNLAIGDVINIDYELEFVETGRFYKDYVDYYQFDSFHPCAKTSYTILVPDGIKLNYKVANGNLKFSKEKIKGYSKYNWTLKNDLALPIEESYMPNTVDIARYLHISTISSWSEIANWYSDLVRHQKVFSAEVEKEFKKIFPKGHDNLSENDKARKIYYYIMNNFTYSHVPFRQSGFTPQKPSKTINTKLGDCKDFSTLFNTLAEKAGLKSNLVLILTNDYGQNSIILPSQDFNHCIIQVEIDGESQFLELTDKYLPYKSLPISLINATGLLIPNKIDKNQKFQIFKLKNIKKTNSYLEKNIDIEIDDNDQKINIETKMLGSIGSYYFSQFDDNNYKAVKESVKKDLKDHINKDFKLDTIYNLNTKRGVDTLRYSIKLNLTNEEKKIGSISIFQLPIFATVYENSIINTSDRKYPIEYTLYENSESYKTEYNIFIPEGKEFVELPESKKFNYKDHSYSIKYFLRKENHLNVIIEASMNIGNNIPIEDYRKFKAYVKSIIEAKESFIGYK